MRRTPGPEEEKVAMSHSLSPARRRAGVPLAVAALGCAALASPAPAPAAVVGANRSIVVTANTSDVLLSAFANAAVVSLVRDGVTIASGKNVNIPGAAPAEGGINSAHLAGAGGCWTTFTPQILPGDTIKVSTSSTVVHDVTATPLTVEGGQIVVRGTAVGLTGTPLAAAEVDGQIWSPGGRFSAGSSGGQFLSSQRGNLGGVLTYDAPGSTHWTARWPSLGAADNAFALAGSIIGAWTGPAGAPPTAGGEQSHFEAGGVPGPLDNCAASPYAPDGPTAVDHDPVTPSTGLVITGRAQPGVTAVKATVTDAAGKAVSRDATVTGTSWSAGFPAADVDALADGPLSITGAFKLPAGTFHGATMKVTKGVPAAPPAQPAPAAAPVVAQPQPVAVAPSLTLEALTVRSRVTLRSARRHGIHITAFAPQGASVLELKLLR